MNDKEKPVEVEQVKKTAFQEVREGTKEPEGVEKGWKNLKLLSERPEEEQKAIRQKAQKASVIKRKQNQSLKESLLKALESPDIAKAVAKATGNELFELAAEQGATMQELLTLSAMLQIADGNTKMFEFVRDTTGQKPKAELEVNSELTMISAADKALLDSARKIFGDFDEENTSENNQ